MGISVHKPLNKNHFNEGLANELPELLLVDPLLFDLFDIAHVNSVHVFHDQQSCCWLPVDLWNQNVLHILKHLPAFF